MLVAWDLKLRVGGKEDGIWSFQGSTVVGLFEDKVSSAGEDGVAEIAPEAETREQVVDSLALLVCPNPEQWYEKAVPPLAF